MEGGGDPGGSNADNDDGTGSLQGGADKDGNNAVVVKLVADSLDFDTVFQTEADKDDLAAVIANVVQLQGFTLLAPTVFDRGSIIVNMTVAARDQTGIEDLFGGCSVCFRFQGFNICPRPATDPSCSKSGIGSIAELQKQQDAAQAAAAAENRGKTTQIVIPVIVVLLLLAIVLGVVVSRRRLQEAREREDEREASELTDLEASSAKLVKPNSGTDVDEAMYGPAATGVIDRKSSVRAMLKSVSSEGDAASDLRPAGISLTTDSSSLRLVSTRRQNPMFTPPPPTYAQADAGISEVPEYASADASAVGMVDYAVASNGGMPMYEAAGATSVPIYADANTTQPRSPNYVEAITANYAEPLGTVNYDVAAQSQLELIPTGDLLGQQPTYASADAGSVKSANNSRRGSIDQTGLNHIPGQPLRRSNSYGDALNEIHHSDPNNDSTAADVLAVPTVVGVSGNDYEYGPNAGADENYSVPADMITTNA